MKPDPIEQRVREIFFDNPESFHAIATYIRSCLPEEKENDSGDPLWSGHNACRNQMKKNLEK